MTEDSTVDKYVYVTEMRYDNGAGSAVSRSIQPDNTLGAGAYSGLGWNSHLLFDLRLGEFDNAEDDANHVYYDPAEVIAAGKDLSEVTLNTAISGGFRQTATWKFDKGVTDGPKTVQLLLTLEDWMSLGGGGSGGTGTGGSKSFVGGNYSWNSYSGHQFHRTGYALHSYLMSVFFGMTSFDGTFKMRDCDYDATWEIDDSGGDAG
jgi:hypothetical protein